MQKVIMTRKTVVSVNGLLKVFSKHITILQSYFSISLNRLTNQRYNTHNNRSKTGTALTFKEKANILQECSPWKEQASIVCTSQVQDAKRLETILHSCDSSKEQQQKVSSDGLQDKHWPYTNSIIHVSSFYPTHDTSAIHSSWYWTTPHVY